MNIGRSYRVTELLGRGAFGAVYLADTVGAGLPKKVAVKVLNPDRAVSPELVGRLRDEARMLSLIHHRAIVRVDDLVQLNGQWSVIMEYVEGVDLGVLLRKGPVPPRATLAIVSEVAGALHAAYNQTGPDGVALRLVHRDIKPSNVRVTAAGEVKLLDFGVARAEFSDREVGTTHATFGTLSYMSPERFKGEDTHAGDMYAVGIMLFELLTGLRPGASAADPERTPPGKNLRPQWEWIEQLSAPLHELISDLLSPDPTRRPIGKECARTLDRIRGHIAGDTLEDWCEKVVPGVVQSSRMPPDGTTGTLLVEKGPGVVKAAPSSPLRLVGVAGAAAVVLVAGGIWGISQLERPSKESTPSVAAPAPAPAPVAAPAPAPAPAAAAAPAPAKAPAPAPAKAPAPVAAPAPAKAPAPAPAKAPAPVAAPAPAKAPAPAPVAAPAPVPAPAPEPAPAPAPAPANGKILVSGEFSSAKVVGAAGSFSPGSVPPGLYTVSITLIDGTQTAVRNVVLDAGGSVSITCKVAFGGCKKQ